MGSDFLSTRFFKSLVVHGMAISFLAGCNSDRVGFKTTSSVSGAPSITINGGNEFTNKGTVDLSIHGAGFDEMYITNDPTCVEGGEWEPTSESKLDWSLSGLNSKVKVYAKFRAETGERSLCISDLIMHDDQPPAVQFPILPVAVSNKIDAEMNFEVSENGSGLQKIECRSDGSGYSECQSPWTATDLSEANHDFAVRAVDMAGNVSEVLAHEWRVDKSAPMVELSEAPRNPNNTKNVAFVFTGSDGDEGEIEEYLCRLPGQVYQTCESPYEMTNLQDGPHRFSVIVKDTAGNTSSPAMHEWVLDTVVPTVDLMVYPNDPTNLTTATFEFTGLDDSTGVEKFQCALDGNAFADCASPVNYMNLTDGSHEFRVVAIDYAGNVSQSVDFTWMVDTVKPTVTITSYPTDPSKHDSATFEFMAADSGSGVMTTFCRIDNNLAQPCQSPVTYTDLAEGNHTFYVFARDNAGNTSDTETYTWMVDTIKPVVTIDNGPTNPTNNPDASFEFSGTDTNGSGVDFYECRLDNGSFVQCTSAQNYTALADGTHQFWVRAVDRAGNVSDAAAFTWVIDTAKPTITITSHPHNPTNDDNAAFEFVATSATPIADYECRLDNGNFESCTSAKLYMDLDDGTHQFWVRATDLAGNTSDPAAYTWLIDTVKPTVTITNHPTDPTAETTASFEFMGADTNGSGIDFYECRLDNGSFGTCTSAQVYNNLADGNHEFWVRATDLAGNVSTAAAYAWMVDATAPTLTWISVPTNPTTETDATFEFMATDDGSGVADYECQLDGGTAVSCSSPEELSQLAEGDHTFSVVAIDAVGNRSQSLPFTWTIQVNSCFSQQITQPEADITKKVDILFAIDTSGSFNAEKQDVISEMEAMIANLPQDTDYRLAVVLGHGDQSSHSGALYAAGSSPMVLDSQQMSLTDIQDALSTTMANAPGDGDTDGGEAVIYSLSKLLEPSGLAAAQGHGFFRDDAALAVILMSDENDICARVPNGVVLPPDGDGNEGPAFDNYCVNPDVTEQSVYNQLVSLQGSNPLLVSAIVYTDENTVPNGGENSLGYGFFDIVALNDGILIDLASNSYAAGLADIGQLTTERLNLITRIPLEQPNVIENTISVMIDNVVSTDFTYSSATNEVLLGFAGQALSIVDVQYCVNP